MPRKMNPFNNAIERLYTSFFKEHNINAKTGQVNDYPELRFATYPYIGSRYAEAPFKLLVVGMDIGKDETFELQSFETRRENIDKPCDFNPHIAGTYASTVFFLKHFKESFPTYQAIWEQLDVPVNYARLTKTPLHENDNNPLKYIALTNFFKFVTNDRKLRSGDENRKVIFEKELQLLVDEIKEMQPDLALFQGLTPLSKIKPMLESNGIAYGHIEHPSNRKKNGRHAGNNVASLSFDSAFELRFPELIKAAALNKEKYTTCV